MFGVDVMITEDLQSAVALEVNGMPQIKEGMDEDMQLGMMEVVLGEKLPREDRARKQGAGVAADGWLEVGAAAAAGGAGEGGELLLAETAKGSARRAATQTEDLPPCCPYL